jgi:AraC-like DNA-binding protein
MNIHISHINLISYIENFCKEDGLSDTKIESLKFYTTTEKSESQSIIYEPSICIALQGEKAVGFGDDMYSYNSSKYLLTCTNVPADIKIEKASKETPYVSLVLSFSLEEIYEVIKDANEILSKNIKKIQNPLRFNKLDNTLLDPVYRLVQLLDKPQKTIDFMYPLIKKEIIYILLQNDRDFLKNYVMEGTLANQIVKAISEIKNNFNNSINMASLAKDIGISEASLYQNFKKVTSMSPLQYQKKIRLQEAKQMLLSQNLTAHEVAFNVGYESASQFSREYSKIYGMSPKAHSQLLRDNQSS